MNRRKKEECEIGKAGSNRPTGLDGKVAPGKVCSSKRYNCK